MKNIALINYYARLIKKNRFKLEDVEERYREDVEKALENMPEFPPDPITQTPETTE